MATATEQLQRLATARALLQRPPLPVRIQENERPRPVHIQNGECPAPGTVVMLPPEQLLLDPPRFQFRLSQDRADGTSGRLEGCPVFRLEFCGALLAWIDPADGSGPWLVDGHHRRRLALEDAAPLVPVLLVEAATEADARALGALSNVAAGTASPQDLCRLLRDQELDPKTLARRFGLQRNSRVVADARALLALEDGLFSRCCIGELGLDAALALCEAKDHTLQLRLWAMAAERCWSAPQVLEAAHLAQLAPAGPAEAPTGCLPGFEELMRETNHLLDEQLLVRSVVRRLLRLENRAARIVGHHRAAEALERRNVASVDRQAAAEVRAESGALLDRFALLCGYSGPLAALLTELAQLVADGGDAARLVEGHMDQIRAVLAAELS